MVDSPILSLRFYFWALLKDKDMENNCRAILLERDDKGYEAVGRFILCKVKGLKGRAAQL